MDTSEAKRKAFNILAKITQGSFYAVTLGAIAVGIENGIEPAYAVVAQGVLINGINGILDRLSVEDKVSTEEIQQVVEESGIAKLFNEHEQTQVLVGRLFRRLDVLQQIGDQNQSILFSLLEQSKGFQSFAIEIQTELALVKNKLQGFNDLIELIKHILSSYSPALSPIPKTTRPLLNVQILGREADLEWLRLHINQDCLLVGQPGSGKTFLLYKFAQEANCLFVVENNREKLIREIRMRQPQAVIVDDAHVEQDLVKNLLHIRSSNELNFAIYCSCWPGEQDGILQPLRLVSSKVIKLDRLGEKVIAEVIKSAGLLRPNNLIQEIINQSNGLPGLAITLVDLLRDGGWHDVVVGNILMREANYTLKRILGSEEQEILAAIAVGGRLGMLKESVAECLGLRLGDVSHKLAKLEAAGIITVLELDPNRLVVQPATLRSALVKDQFFRTIPTFSNTQISSLIKAADPEEVALTFIAAQWQGADISQELLIELLEKANSFEAWKLFAWLGQQQVEWILMYHPELKEVIIEPALQKAPKLIIPILLERRINDNHTFHRNNPPLHYIKEWLEGNYQGSEEVCKQRYDTWKIAEEWTLDKNVQIGIQILALIISPEYQKLEPVAGSDGEQASLIYGYISEELMLYIQKLWLSEIIHLLKKVKVTNWTPITDVIGKWVYIDNIDDKPPVQAPLMRSIAEMLIRDLIPFVSDRQGILRQLKQYIIFLDTDILIPLIPEFEILYPIRETDDWMEDEKRQIETVKELALEWSKLAAVDVLTKLEMFENEAQSVNLTYPRFSVLLCREIAQQAENVREWHTEALRLKLPSDIVSIFKKRI